MIKRSIKPSRCWRTGMTLVEVLAGLALLASVLVGLLAAKAGYTRQSARAELRLRAAGAADELLAGWWQSSAGVPRLAAGEAPGGAGLLWRTRPVANVAVEDLGAQNVRLEILSAAANGRAPSFVLSVDVALPPEAQTR